MTLTLTLNLPLPPSVNRAYANRKRGKGRGRVKNKTLRDWVRDADAHYTLQHLGKAKPITGKYHVTIYMPESLHGDEDNRVKPVLDWMVARNLTPDDRHMHGHEIKRCPELHEKMLWIIVKELET